MTLDQLKKLCDEATPGPWTHSHIFASEEPVYAVRPDGSLGLYVANAESEADGEFIAAARTYLPKAIEAAMTAPHTCISHRHLACGGCHMLKALAAPEAK